MTIINTSPDRFISLGYEGEDKVTVLRFRYPYEWRSYGEGVFRIRVRRHGENRAYNAELLTVDLTHMELLMTVTNVELSVKGTGEMQVVYSGADFVKKSPIYSYNVSRAVDEAVDPPAQDVYTQIIESLSDLQTDVSGISDAVDGIGNLADLTTEDKSSLVSAINEVNEHSGGGSVTVDDALSTTSENPVQNKVVTSAIQSKADIRTVSALSDAVNGLDSDIQGLQTAVQGKVDDVQVDGGSIVTDGVANVPIAGSYNTYGVFKVSSTSGLSVNAEGALSVYRTSASEVKNGTVQTRFIPPSLSNHVAFYGFAKAAGYDEKNSILPIGQYTEEAKTAIRTMLGLQDVYEDYSSALDAIGGGS